MGDWLELQSSFGLLENTNYSFVCGHGCVCILS